MDKKRLLQKSGKWLSEKLNICIIIIYVIAVFLCLVCPSASSVTGGFNDTNMTDVSSEWFYKLEDNTFNTMSSFIHTHQPEKNTIYQLTSVLPDKLGQNYALLFTTKNCYVTVMVNDTLYYRTTTEDITTAVSYLGSKVHVIGIPDSAAGSNITIYFRPVSNEDTEFIHTIYGGSEDLLIDTYVQRYALSLFVVLLVIVASIIFMTIGALNHKRNDGQIRFYFGLFSFCSSILIMAHMDVLSLFVDCSVFLYELEFMTMALLPYPILSYIMAANGILPSLRHNIAKAVPLLHFFFVVLMHVTGLMPLNVTNKGTSIVFVYLVCITLYYLIKIHLDTKPWTNMKAHIHDYVKLLFLCFCSVEIYLLHTAIAVSSHVISHYLLLIILLMQLIKYARDGHQLMEIGINAKHLEDAAFYDALTGLRNRTALNQDIEKLEHNLNPASNIAIIQMDINYLKRTNDVLGHIAGDRLLKNAASTIHAGFDDYGKCYRFGGDEFVVILENNPKEKYNLGISAMESACEKINKSLPALEHVSIAYGIAYYEPDSDTSLWRVQERADVVMYERKRAMKEKAAKTNYKDDRL